MSSAFCVDLNLISLRSPIKILRVHSVPRLPLTAMQTRPTGFFAVPPSGPAMPVMPTPISVWMRARTPSAIAETIAAAIALLGEDRVSLGSDYDGSVDAPFDTAHLAALTQALMDAGLTDAQIAKVMGGNMMRYLAETL